MAKSIDRRVRRTRESLLQAFNELVLEHGRGEIRVTDIVEQADVGRSTFYEHYSSADDLYMQALASPMSILADAAAGLPDTDRLEKILAHFWDNRTRARTTFTGDSRDKVMRLLAGQIAERIEASDQQFRLPLPLVAHQLAELALAPVRGWVSAIAPSTAGELAEMIIAATTAVREALEEKKVSGPVGD